MAKQPIRPPRRTKPVAASDDAVTAAKRVRRRGGKVEGGVPKSRPDRRARGGGLEHLDAGGGLPTTGVGTAIGNPISDPLPSSGSNSVPNVAVSIVPNAPSSPTRGMGPPAPPQAKQQTNPAGEVLQDLKAVGDMKRAFKSGGIFSADDDTAGNGHARGGRLGARRSGTGRP